MPFRVKTCSNCGLENGGDVLLCAGCSAELSGAGSSNADAVLSVSSDEGVHVAGASPSWKQKSLRIRILEWFLVLFALWKSGVVRLGFYLCLTRGLPTMTYPSEIFDWIYYISCKVGALGILGYVLFRNSRWCQTQAMQPTGRENAMAEPAWSRVSNRDSRRLRFFEFCLVLFVAFAGGILYSFEVLLGHVTIPDEPTISSLARDVYEMLSFTGALGLLSYVHSRNSRGFEDLGLRWTSRDVAVALPLALGDGLAFRLLRPMAFWGG
jgi:hypothetical protein